METEKIRIGNIPAILYGTKSEKLFIFVHGRHSKKEEAESFANIVNNNGYQVFSFDLPQHGERINEKYDCTIQNGIHDLIKIYTFVQQEYKYISLYACSLGVYFSLSAYQNIQLEKCLFVSPVLDMEKLIKNIMKWSNVSERELKNESKIETSIGETLSWDYYEFVKKNPIKKWNKETFILYGENDNITEKDVIDNFVEVNKCNLDIMKKGEHYFHTIDQINYLQNWIKKIIE